MAKKDVLFLCQFFYPEYISSALLPFDTAKALQQEGFSVGVLCGYPREYYRGDPIPVKEVVEDVSIHRLKYIQMDRKGFIGRLVNYFSFTLTVLLHLGEISRYRSVVVYSNPPILPWIASWAGKLFGTKLIFVSYDLYPEVATVTDTLREGNLICRLMEHINRCVYPNACRVVALSHEMRDYILANRQISPDRVAVIPNWYADQGAPMPAAPDNPFRIMTGNRFVVSYFGNMGTAQDMDTILGAVRKLRDCDDVYFLFAGHGNKMQKLKAILEEEQVSNAKVLDFLHGDDYSNALAASDAALVTLEKGVTGLCVPSKTYSYMMQGIPLLAIMDECDIVRDIGSGAGRWVRNGEVGALADAILSMQRDPDGCGRMRSKCRELYLQKYTSSICTEKYVSMFRELLKPDLN